jgi:hypothetical protein
MALRDKEVRYSPVRAALDQVPRVFLSYAHADRESVAAVDQWLRDHDVRVDLDERDFVAGRDIRDEVLRSISQAGKVVCFYSSASRDRYYTKLERRVAEEIEQRTIADGRPKTVLLYFRLDETPLPADSSYRLAINAWRMDFFDACKELLRNLLERSAEPARMPLARYKHRPPWRRGSGPLPPPDNSRPGAALSRERAKAVTALQDRLATARKACDVDALRAVQAALGDLDDTEVGLTIDLLQSYVDVSAWGDAVDLVAAMPAVLRRASHIRDRQAFALNRLGRHTEAEVILLQLIDERGPDSETYGLLGRVYEDQWQDALRHPAVRRSKRRDPNRQGRTRPAEVLLDRAIEAYLAGFAADSRDHDPGISAVRLMYLRDPTDKRIAELLPVVRYSVRQKVLRQHADFWDYAVLLELALLNENADDAWAAVADATSVHPASWQVLSTLDTLVRLRSARERILPLPDWMHEIEAELERLADLESV